MKLNDASMGLILKFEVGGGESYYNKFLRHPTWPKGASGVTIGIGYDLGYNSPASIKNDWGQLPEDKVKLLMQCAKVTGVAAQDILGSVKDVDVPWATAFAVYENVTIPKFWKVACATFPGTENLNPNCQGALLSLVFNRGGSLKGDSRIEMRNIKSIVPNQDYRGIAEQIRNMKRLWRGTKIENGMSRRRDAEADLVLSSLSHV